MLSRHPTGSTTSVSSLWPRRRQALRWLLFNLPEYGVIGGIASTLVGAHSEPRLDTRAGRVATGATPTSVTPVCGISNNQVGRLATHGHAHRSTSERDVRLHSPNQTWSGWRQGRRQPSVDIVKNIDVYRATGPQQRVHLLGRRRASCSCGCRPSTSRPAVAGVLPRS